MKINVHACSDIRLPPVVLIHGWGCDAQIWQPLLAHLSAWADVITVDLDYHQQTIKTLIGGLASCLPEKFILVGWSLGGMLATEFTIYFPQRVVALITLATNLRFVANRDWPAAMPLIDFERFQQGVIESPVKQLSQFIGLVSHGDQLASKQRRWLRQVMVKEDKQSLAEGLFLLAEFDHSGLLEKLTVPALFCFGEQDALVPVSTASDIEVRLTEGQQVKMFAERGHLLHYPAADCLNTFEHFLKRFFNDVG